MLPTEMASTWPGYSDHRPADGRGVEGGASLAGAQSVFDRCWVDQVRIHPEPGPYPRLVDSGELLPTLSFGDEVLLRYRYQDGSFQAALPMRVVLDGSDRLVTWLAPGTPIMYWALSDGRDPRGVPLGQRFDQKLTTEPRTWQGNGVLRVIPANEPFQVLHFWDDSGEFAGWYVNFESPITRRGVRLDSVDWHLDLWIDPNGVPSWKDEDEALAALGAGHLKERELATARATGRRIIDGLGDWPGPIGEWRTFSPPRDWTIPSLPDDWRS